MYGYGREDSDAVTRWEVELSDPHARLYAVVKVVDGERQETRARWSRLSCIEAQVIAQELNDAWDEGWDAGREHLARFFTTPLGD